jgi:hypothetical protein
MQTSFNAHMTIAGLRIKGVKLSLVITTATTA